MAGASPTAKVIITGDGSGAVRAAREVSKAFGSLDKDLRKAFVGGARDANDALTGLAQRAGSAFATLRNPLLLTAAGIASVGYAAYQAGKAALSMGSAFQTGMTNVETLFGDAPVDMKALGDQALAVALKFRRAPALIAEALYEWVSANGRVDDGLAEFSEAVKASVGGVASAKVAVDGMTTILNAYGQAAGGAAHVSDLMFQTVNKGKIRFEELAGQIGLVVSTAKGADVPLNDLMAAIATATAQGIRPSSAMEGLRSAISNIIKPTDKAITTAKLLGLQFGLGALKAKGFAGLLKDIREKTKGNTETMAQLFGDVSGLNVVLALTGEGAGMFSDNLVLMERAGGSTDAAFRKQQGTFAETAKGLLAIGEAAAVGIFNKFEPYLTRAGQWVIDNWPKVSAQLRQTGSDLAGMVSLGLTPFQVAWDAARGAITAVLQLLRGDLKGASDAAGESLRTLGADLTGFKTTWESIQVPEWVKVLGGAAVALAATRGALAGLTLVLQGAAAALGALDTLLTAASAGGIVKMLASLGPLIARLIGGGGLVAAFALVVDKAAILLYSLVGLAEGALLAIPVWGWIAAAAIAAAALIYANWDKIGPWFAETWAAVKTAFANGIESIRAFITETVPQWWEGFKTWLSTTLAGIGQWFIDLPGNIAAGVVNVGAWLGQKIPEWGYAFGTWLGDSLKAIVNWFLNLGEQIATSVAFAAGWLSVKIPEWVKAFGTWLSDSWTTITTWFSELPGKVGALIQTVATYLATTVPQKWDAFTNWLGEFGSKLQAFFAELPGKFTTWLTNVVSAIPGLIGAFIEKGRELANAIWQGMTDSIGGFFAGIPGRVQGIIQNTVDAFKKGQGAAGDGAPATEPIPEFGVGALVRRRTLAVLGEKGEEEAVVPRSGARAWLPLIAQWAGLAAAPVPALAGLGADGGASGGLSIGSLTVVVQAPPGTDNPRAWGAAAGDGLYDQLARMIKL